MRGEVTPPTSALAGTDSLRRIWTWPHVHRFQCCGNLHSPECRWQKELPLRRSPRRRLVLGGALFDPRHLQARGRHSQAIALPHLSSFAARRRRQPHRRRVYPATLCRSRLLIGRFGSVAPQHSILSALLSIGCAPVVAYHQVTVSSPR